MVSFIHPLWQFLATILALYVFSLGWPRLMAALSGKKSTFLWKRHVSLGLTALVILLVGLVGGAAVTAHFWGGTGYTRHHYWIGVAMGPLMLFGLVSGLLLDRHKGKYTKLAVVHGLNNVVVLILALAQIWTGLNVIRFFILD